jgi:hypothetical protein
VIAAASVFALASPARAEKVVTVEVGGAVEVEASGHVHVDVGPGELAAHASVGWAFGVDFADPPPPPPPCYDPCGAPVPVAYVEPPPPPPPMVREIYVHDAPPPPVVVRPRKRRFGIGAFAGSVDVDGQEVGSDLGILGRFRMTRRLSLEAEFARSSISDGGRRDRRFGAALLFDFAPNRTLSPYILGGAGFGQTDVEDRELRAGQAYGEVGLGLTYRVSRRFQLVADGRLGQRDTKDDQVAALMVGGGEDLPIQDEEKYSRLRLGALFFF